MSVKLILTISIHICILICMLNKRVNILFNEEEWQKLCDLAHWQEQNASQLIRIAIKKTYFSDNDQNAIKMAVASIKNKRTLSKKINYKALINYGRKN